MDYRRLHIYDNIILFIEVLLISICANFIINSTDYFIAFILILLFLVYKIRLLFLSLIFFSTFLGFLAYKTTSMYIDEFFTILIICFFVFIISFAFNFLLLPSYRYKFRYFLIQAIKDLMVLDEKIDKRINVNNFTKLEFYVMSLEDRRFIKHYGFDIWAFFRELSKLLRGKKYGGASTIDMQFVRTVTGYKDKTIQRKLYEIFLAFLINLKYTKKQIISAYLLIAYLGTGIKGVAEASFKKFGLCLDELSDEQLSMVAAMLLTPMPKEPSSSWEKRLAMRASYARMCRGAVKE